MKETMETKVKRYVNFFPSQKPKCSGPTPFPLMKAWDKTILGNVVK